MGTLRPSIARNHVLHGRWSRITLSPKFPVPCPALGGGQRQHERHGYRSTTHVKTKHQLKLPSVKRSRQYNHGQLHHAPLGVQRNHGLSPTRQSLAISRVGSATVIPGLLA
jgi:hypothetical protein